MSLHQLVANALWKFGMRPVWLSIFPSSLQLCCVKSQTSGGRARDVCGNAARAPPAASFYFVPPFLPVLLWRRSTQLHNCAISCLIVGAPAFSAFFLFFFFLLR